MSVSIRVKAIYGVFTADFIMPSIYNEKECNTVDIDFEGQARIEARNIDGEMKITGRGVDSGGFPLYISEDDVTFTVLN
jgi:hypothetical protein